VWGGATRKNAQKLLELVERVRGGPEIKKTPLDVVDFPSIVLKARFEIVEHSTNWYSDGLNWHFVVLCTTLLRRLIFNSN